MKLTLTRPLTNCKATGSGVTPEFSSTSILDYALAAA